MTLKLLCFAQLLLLPLVATKWDLAVSVSSRVEFLELDDKGRGQTVDTQDVKVYNTVFTINPDRNVIYYSEYNSRRISCLHAMVINQPYTERVLSTEPSPRFKIESISFDRIRNVLYWTNGEGMEIVYLDLNDPKASRAVLHKFSDRETVGVAVDACIGKLFWSSVNGTYGGYIQTSDLDGGNLQELHRITYPRDMIVVEKEQKLYWIDYMNSPFFKIERSNYDGTNRELLVYSSDQTPVSLASISNYIYWTELKHRSVRRQEKLVKELTQEMKMVYIGDKSPYVISYPNSVEYTVSWESLFPNCSLKSDKADTQKSLAVNSLQANATAVKGKIERKDHITEFKCFNGEMQEAVQNREKKCLCDRGFHGLMCEIPSCYNYCIQGDCYIDPQGFALCSCYPGYHGVRCEHDTCNNYCLNGGQCSIGDRGEKICTCSSEYQGRRCEVKCSQYCAESHIFVSLDPGIPSLCSCSTENVYQIITSENASAVRQPQVKQKNDSIEMPLIISLVAVGIVCIIFICVTALLMVKVLKLRKRPRIKKRIIVNKNITPTPLTSRPPLPSDQCEITIENCCNMNICETPCYEPQFRAANKTMTKTEEKKNLLGNMEDEGSRSPSQDTLY